MRLTKDHLIEGQIIKKGTNIRIKESIDKDTLIDWIGTYLEMGEEKKAKKYIGILLADYNIEYNQRHLPFIDITSPYTSYKTKANKYSKLFKNKTLNTDLEEVVEVGRQLGIDINTKEVARAYTMGKTIWINSSHTRSDSYFLASTFIHELGHFFMNYLAGKDTVAILADINNASTNYGVSSSSECGAEHFLMYFIEPGYLKAGWNNVYKDLDSSIPRDWVKHIQDLMK